MGWKEADIDEVTTRRKELMTGYIANRYLGVFVMLMERLELGR